MVGTSTVDKVDVVGVDVAEKGEKHVDTRPQIVGFTAAEEELPPGYFRSAYFLGTFFATVFSDMSAAGVYGMIGSILTQVNADLGNNVNILWVPCVYTLATSVGLLLFGRLTDLFGRRWFFIGGSLLAVIGSVVSSRAQDVATLIAGMLFIGLGASAGLSYVTVLTELVPMKHRFFIIGIFMIFIIPIGFFSAAIAAAFEIYTGPGWRWVFYLMIITNGLATLLWFVFYHPPTFHMKNRDRTRIYMLRHFDYVGALLFVAGTVLFLMGLLWGGQAYPWKSAHVITTIIVGFVCLVSLAAWEIRAPLQEPLIPVHLFKNVHWVASVLLLGFGASVYYATALVWPEMVTVVYRQGNTKKDQMWAGWISSLLSIAFTLGEVSGGLLAEKIGRVKYQCMFMITMGSVCLASMAVCNLDNLATGIALLVMSLFSIGWNEAIAFSMTTICIHNQQEIGSAAGCAGAARSVISSIASVIYQVVLRTRITQTVPRVVVPAVIQAGLPQSSVAAYLMALASGSAAALSAVKGITPAIEAAGAYAYRVANAAAYHPVFLTSIAFGVISVGLTFFVPNVDALMTHEIATTLHTRGNEAELIGQSGRSQEGKQLE
ncbi:hypothetical protein A1O3_10226 [Capronia epimyces CBS 606.96]|uniref:Major facilitator superfamily (MFS) profile domain-containing protein n=1 Tax=Capronia epimyces CBS 606.96 TaxID=1182542 RepID=W9XA23_9EURO|nr:uncharacterized protein A1O3_10226 [Capronia epimyces CBS 606.96]EXJ77068.1 hypothetical protein A1O3_10226 [Capronia epimyces CBS 606.96]